MTKKVCTGCKKSLDKTNFCKDRGQLYHRCRLCERNRKLVKRYKITQRVYNAMLAAQGGRCAICNIKSDPLHVDHCHDSEVVRGLLCGKCNRGIGSLNHCKKILQKAIEYLDVG